MVHNEKYKTVAIYSRVSMSDQDASRQLHELRDFAEREYPCAEIVEFYRHHLRYGDQRSRKLPDTSLGSRG